MLQGTSRYRAGMSQESKDPDHPESSPHPPLETTASGGRSGSAQMPALVSQASAGPALPAAPSLQAPDRSEQLPGCSSQWGCTQASSLALGPRRQWLPLLTFPIPTPGFWMHPRWSLVPISTQSSLLAPPASACRLTWWLGTLDST